MKTLGEFLDGFVKPLVAGGELHVKSPVDLERVETWTGEIDGLSEHTVPIDEIRQGLAAEILVRPPPLLLGAAEVRLAAAAYDAMCLGHPKFDGFPTGRRARERVTGHALQLAAAPPALSRWDLVARHTLLHNLLDVSRVDISLRWWTGRAEFRGQKPPSRLTAWPGIRRVREERETVPLHELCLAVRGVPGDVIGALLVSSPLTDLMTPARPLPPFEWTPEIVRILSDVELARSIAYRWLGDEPDASRLIRHPAAAAASWFRMLERPLPPPLLRAVTQFLVHISVLVALAESRAEKSTAPSPILREAIDHARPDAPDDGISVLVMLPEAAAITDPATFIPPGLDDEPVVLARWKAHRTQVHTAFEDARIHRLAQRLSQSLATTVAA